MNFGALLSILASLLATSSVTHAALQMVNPTTDCTITQITSKGTHCCNGVCLDQTLIGKPGACLNWADECQSAPKCAENQYGRATNMTGIKSGDGCCYGCGLNPQACQWELFQWTYSCCNCPEGYISASRGECGQFVGLCYKCDGAGEVLTQNGTKWQCGPEDGTLRVSTSTGTRAGTTLATVASTSSKPTSSAATSNTTPVSSTSQTGLSTGAKAGIGVGVSLGVVALAGLLFLLWKTGVLAGILGGGTAGATSGTAAGGSAAMGSTAAGGPEAMQATLAAKPLVMGSNTAGTAALGAVAGALVVGGAATSATAANGSNAANAAKPANGPPPSTADLSSAGHTGTAMTGAEQSGASGPASTAGPTASTNAGGVPGTGGSGVGGSAGPTGATGATGTHHAGGFPGFFGLIGLRRKKSKDKKATNEQKEPLTGGLEAAKKSDISEKKQEIGGEQIHEVDESVSGPTSEIDSLPKHELK